MMSPGEIMWKCEQKVHVHHPALLRVAEVTPQGDNVILDYLSSLAEGYIESDVIFPLLCPATIRVTILTGDSYTYTIPILEANMPAFLEHLNDIGDVSVPSPTHGYVLTFDQPTALWLAKAPTFLNLTDTPSVYTDHAGKLLKVKSAQDGLEFLSGWQAIAEVIPTSDVDYVDFSNLDNDTDKFYLLYLTLINVSASGATYRLYINGDYTKSNYYSQYLLANNTTVTSGRGNQPKLGYIGPGNTMFILVIITRDPSGYLNALTFDLETPGSGVRLASRSISSSDPISNITSIRVFSNEADGIGTGSKLLLCKPRTA